MWISLERFAACNPQEQFLIHPPGWIEIQSVLLSHLTPPESHRYLRTCVFLVVETRELTLTAKNSSGWVSKLTGKVTQAETESAATGLQHSSPCKLVGTYTCFLHICAAYVAASRTRRGSLGARVFF